MKRSLFTIVFVLLISLSALLVAQDLHKMVVEIPNAFLVSGKELPAGSYEVELAASHLTVSCRALNGKNASAALISTVIAADSSKPTEGKVVFDNVGGQRILSEVWLPGHDGYLIAGFKGDAEHKHSVLKGKPAK